MSPLSVRSPKIAIILPAYNEELTIAATLRDFAEKCPEADLWVVDNNSADKTSAVVIETLQALGRSEETLLHERRQGKAHAMRRAFATIDADIYVMVDADSTYAASDLRMLLAPVAAGEADMVVGDRHASGDYSKENTRAFHGFGNSLVTRMINRLFGASLSDILSGYRIFSRRFVKSFPVLTGGFELETELTLHALALRLTTLEIPISFRERPAGSTSKLNTFSDGLRIIGTMLRILRYNRPFAFFSWVTALFVVAGLGVGSIPVVEFFLTGKILHFPSAILASGLILCGFLSFSIALTLDMLARVQNQLLELRLNDFSTMAQRDQKE